jgi:acyl-CoA thioesterase I
LYQEEAYLLQNFFNNAPIKQKQIQHTFSILSPVNVAKGKTRARLALVLLSLALLILSSCTQASASSGSTTKKSASPALIYVAIGASDTFGIGAQEPYTQNWATDLNAFLGSQSHLINLGVPGMTLHVALSAELPVAIDSHPNLITIWLAVNDLATNVPINSYSQDLNTMLTRLQQAAPDARIEVGNVPDLTRVPFFHSYNQAFLSQQIEVYNTAIASVVARHHVILVDLSEQGYNLQTAPEFISNDGLHPSTLGYQQVARLFYSALEKAEYSRMEA